MEHAELPVKARHSASGAWDCQTLCAVPGIARPDALCRGLPDPMRCAGDCQTRAGNRVGCLLTFVPVRCNERHEHHARAHSAACIDARLATRSQAMPGGHSNAWHSPGAQAPGAALQGLVELAPAPKGGLHSKAILDRRAVNAQEHKSSIQVCTPATAAAGAAGGGAH